jgi:hypothetical protein
MMPQPMTGKKFLLVTREGMQEMFKLNGVYRIKSHLPSDAKLVGVVYDPDQDSYKLVYESKAWPLTPEGTYLLMQDFGGIERVGSL